MSPRGEENFAKFGWVAALSWLTLSFAKFSRFVRGEVIEGSSLGALTPDYVELATLAVTAPMSTRTPRLYGVTSRMPLSRAGSSERTIACAMDAPEIVCIEA